MKFENKDPRCFYYKGLSFPKYHGDLSREELRSGKTFYAFFGGLPMAAITIKYQVDSMIERGLYKLAAA